MAEIGWASTASLLDLNISQLEVFPLRQGVEAWRVRSEVEVYAPKTRLITFVCRFVLVNGRWIVTVYSVYPGPDIGQLRDGISEKGQVVFFGWNHRGALK